MSKAKPLIMSRLLPMLLLLLIIGCGTMRLDFHTTIESPKHLIQKIEITASGPLGELVVNEIWPKVRDAPEWKAELALEADSYKLTAVKEFKGENSLMDIALWDENGARLRQDIQEKHGERIYKVKITLPSSRKLLSEEEKEELAALEQLVTAMFKIVWTVTLPGEIIYTNADRSTENKAVWFLSLTRLEEDIEMVVMSCEHLPAPSLLAACSQRLRNALKRE